MYVLAILALLAPLVFLGVGFLMVLQGTMWRAILAVLVSLGVLIVMAGFGSGVLTEGHTMSGFFIGGLFFAAATLGLLLGLIWATDRRRMMWTTIFAVLVSLVVGVIMMPFGMWLGAYFFSAPTIGGFAATFGLLFGLIWAIHRRRMMWTMIFAAFVLLVVGFVMLPVGLREVAKLTGVFLPPLLPTGAFFFAAMLGLLLGLARWRRDGPPPSRLPSSRSDQLS